MSDFVWPLSKGGYMKGVKVPLFVWATAISASIPAMSVAKAAPAQQRQPASPSSAPVLQEVIVTAEKKRTNLMTTAVAVSAQSGSQLREEHVTNLEQLTGTTPSFTYANQGPTSAVNMAGASRHMEPMLRMPVTSPGRLQT